MDIIVLFAVICALAYLLNVLYHRGYLTSRSICAFYHREKPIDGGHCAKFSGCHGHTRRVLMLEPNARYSVQFQCNIERGEVRAELRDAHTNEVLVLAPNGTGILETGESGRHVLILRYRHATGRCEMTTKKEVST